MAGEAGFRALPTPDLCLRRASWWRKPTVECSHGERSTERSHNCPVFCATVAKRILSDTTVCLSSESISDAGAEVNHYLASEAPF